MKDRKRMDVINGGWPQKILWVDLTKGKIKKTDCPDSWVKMYLGARGFNSRRLYDLLKPGIDAFSPQNALLFGVGPLSGTMAPSSGRFTVTAKSPLTDIFGDSNCGGHFGPELRYAGYSQLIFTGISPKPVFLWIDDDRIELRDAQHLTGKNTWETQETILEELRDPTIQIACIGPAGENLVRFAGVLHGQKRAAGRCGMGAVMGSKNLKAVAVRGTKDVEVAHPGRFEKALGDILPLILDSPVCKWRSHYGTPSIMETSHAHGALAIRNWQYNEWPYVENVSGERLIKEFSLKKQAGFNCWLACKNFCMIREGKFAGTCGEGPDFGVGLVAPMLDIREMEPIIYMNNLFNQYGLDPVSFVEMIAWAMECYEHGIITEKDTGGLSLNWGDSDVVIQLIRMVSEKEGFGKILAEGERRALTLLGKSEASKYMHHVKGMALPIEDPRAQKTTGIGFLTSTRGADHLRSLYVWVTPEMDEYLKSPVSDLRNPIGKGIALKWFENYSAAVDCSSVCKFSWMYARPQPRLPEMLANLVSAATGYEFSAEDILSAGERVYNVEKAFNSREGLTRKDDNFSNPDKFLKEPVKDGPAKGAVLERDQILDEYYQARGWDVATGLQTKGKLIELGLEDLIKYTPVKG